MPALLERIEESNDDVASGADNPIWSWRTLTAAHCLQWQAERTNLNILADAYRFGIETSGHTETGIPAYRWIEKVLLPKGWVKAGGNWLLFRHRGYWQVNFDTQPLIGNIPALRFWNSLTVPQRERARRGERLPFGSLCARQQALFQQAFQYRLLRMADPPSAPEEQPTAYFAWQEEEREEFRAYGKNRYYSSKTPETLMEIVHLNQREGEDSPRYVGALLRDAAFRFATERGMVQYQISLAQEQSL